MKVVAVALLVALSAQLAAAAGYGEVDKPMSAWVKQLPAKGGLTKDGKASVLGAKYDLLFQKIEDRAAGLLTALHILRYHAQGLDASGSRKNPELDDYFHLVQAKVLKLYGSVFHLHGTGPVGGPK